MAKTIRSKAGPKSVEGNPDVLPVMNIMFLLIPALLLAMEVASMGSLSVSPPRTSASHVTNDEAAPRPLRVFIGEDGFFVDHEGQGHNQDAGLERQQTSPTIPVLRGKYDYAALTALAEQYKATDRRARTVRVSAEGNVSMQVLVDTMDALRGQDCQLSDIDEPGASGCLFPDTVVAAS